MAYSYSYLQYKDTGYFSRLVNDYLSDSEGIRQFYGFPPTAAGLSQAIAQRADYKVNRSVLVSVLQDQYKDLNTSPKTVENIGLLRNENTYTVCTAHQPNLLTGYLYFIYKILHAIKLAEELATLHPGKNFVPVYYMGSEDNDLDELGTFLFRGTKYVWDGNGQTGAVGRMNTAGLKTLLQEVFKLFGPPGPHCEGLKEMITSAYLNHNTVGSATQYLVNELFGRYGLVVIDPDDARLKAQFIPVMEDELLHQAAYPVIAKQIESLGATYKIQAHPRPINLFYLTDQLRERIEQKDDHWVVVNTNIQWNKDELLAELNAHPERFSPNVMLRGLFQETILPNIAFIGGGAEVAYWMQLKALFEHYRVFLPAIHLRQSVMWVNSIAGRLKGLLELNIVAMFRPELQLVHDHIEQHSTSDWHTTQEYAAIETIFQSLKQKATALDATLSGSAEAALTKIRYQLKVLEQKMYRAEKRKMQTQVSRIKNLKATLFPKDGLQERVENFMEYYLSYGPEFFDVLKDGMQPLSNEFLVVEE